MSCVVALIMVVGFTAAPAAAMQGSIVDDTVGDAVDTDAIDLDTTDSSSSSSGGVNVDIVDTNSPVETGETLEVTVDVESVDGGSVDFLIDGEVIEETGYAPGTEDRVTFTWETSYQDVGEHNATVRSATDSDSETVQVEAGGEAPQEVCTDVPRQVHENVPYSQLPSQDQLPEQVPNPVPSVVTPEAVVGLTVGAAPNQCDVQDPNDPSIDPENPPTDPNADATVVRAEQYKDGGAFHVTYQATLDQSGNGPGVEGDAGSVLYSGNAVWNSETTLNDGAQSYTVAPRFDGSQSTAEAGLEASAPFGGAGGEIDCEGGECQPDTTGVPRFAEYPAIPAPVWDGED